MTRSNRHHRRPLVGVLALYVTIVVFGPALPAAAVEANHEQIARDSADEAERIAGEVERSSLLALGSFAGASYGAAATARWTARAIAGHTDLIPPADHVKEMVRIVVRKTAEARQFGLQAMSAGGGNPLSRIRDKIAQARNAYHRSVDAYPHLLRARQAYVRAQEALTLVSAIYTWSDYAVVQAKVACNDAMLEFHSAWIHLAWDWILPDWLTLLGDPEPIGHLGRVTTGLRAWGHGTPLVTDHLRPAQVVPQILASQPYVTRELLLYPPEDMLPWYLTDLAIDTFGVLTECSING